MAGSSFAALSVMSRRGTSATHGTPADAGAAIGAVPIGSIPDEPPARPASGSTALPPRVSAASPFAKIVQAQADAQDTVQPREYRSSDSPLAAHVASTDREEHRRGRRDIHAVKTVARLVTAIARKPGSGMPNTVKSQHLAGLLRSAGQAAQRIAASIATVDAHRPWVKAAATEAACTLVASQWESDRDNEVKPIEVQLAAVEGVFREAAADAALRETLDDLGAHGYVEASAPDVAQARVELSLRMAAWDLYSSVTHALLGRGEFRYTYGRTPTQIVQRLLPEVVAIARHSAIRTDNLDLCTAHMQGSLRRVADLLGAEYVSRTRALMDWIADESIDNDEYQRRVARGNERFEAGIAEDLVEWTRANFMAIEAMAPNLLDDAMADEQPVQRPSR
jgi:hypothetical protein